MGNCQATEAAAVLIQHPGGKVDRLYWPTSASEVMKSNPGHYVALVTLYISEEKPGGGGTTRFTRVRLLKPKEALSLGNVYRLITSQEVAKAIRARKQEKMKKNQAEQFRRQQQQQRPQGSGADDKGVQMAEDGRQHNGSDAMDQISDDKSEYTSQSCGTYDTYLKPTTDVSEFEHCRKNCPFKSLLLCHDCNSCKKQEMIQLVRQQRQRGNGTQSAAARSRQWRPTLQSITEAGT